MFFDLPLGWRVANPKTSLYSSGTLGSELSLILHACISNLDLEKDKYRDGVFEFLQTDEIDGDELAGNGANNGGCDE